MAEELIPRLKIVRAPGQLRLAYRWYDLKSALFAGLGIAWVVYVVFLLVLAIWNGESGSLLIISLFLATGLIIAYYGLADLFDTTQILVTTKDINASERPFSWSKPRHLYRPQVRMIFVQKEETRGKAKAAWFNLIAQDIDGKPYTLVSEIHSYTAAHTLQNEIEQFWSLHHSHTPGEFQT